MEGVKRFIDGDTNTSFFPQNCQNKASKGIPRLIHGDQVLNRCEDIEDHIISYSKEFFGSPS